MGRSERSCGSESRSVSGGRKSRARRHARIRTQMAMAVAPSKNKRASQFHDRMASGGNTPDKMLARANAIETNKPHAHVTKAQTSGLRDHRFRTRRRPMIAGTSTKRLHSKLVRYISYCVDE